MDEADVEGLAGFVFWIHPPLVLLLQT